MALDILARPATFTFSASIDTRFHLTVRSDEWSFYFCRDGRASLIRVRDVALKERDDHALLARTPPLREVGSLVREIESRWRIQFHRSYGAAQSDIAGAEPIARAWLASL